MYTIPKSKAKAVEFWEQMFHQGPEIESDRVALPFWVNLDLEATLCFHLHWYHYLWIMKDLSQCHAAYEVLHCQVLKFPTDQDWDLL